MKLDIWSLAHALAYLGYPIEWLLESGVKGTFEFEIKDIADEVFLNTGLKWVNTVPLAKRVHESDDKTVFIMRYPGRLRAIPHDPIHGKGHEAVQNMLVWSAYWHWPTEAEVEGYFGPIDDEEIIQ